MALQDLCRELSAAKARMELAKEEVAKIENDILATIPPKLEGSQTIPAGNFKLTTTHKLTRKLDLAAYQALDLPENLAFVDFKPSINLKKLRAVEQVDPGLVALCVTSKPAKTSVKVEEVSDES